MSIALIAGALSPLAACDSSDLTVPNLAQAKISSFSCQETVAAIDTLDAAIREDDSDTLNDIGVNTENTKSIQTSLSAQNAKACNSKPVVTVGEEAKVDTYAKGGERSNQPVVGDNGRIVAGDSTREIETPPSVAAGEVLQRCSRLAGWDQFAPCMEGQQWYIDAVNRMAQFTGYTWDDVLKWATAKDVNGKLVDARTIQVFNLSQVDMPEPKARNAVRGLIGNDADILPFPVYHGEFINSRGLKEKTVSSFVDRKRQVRIALSPLVLNKQGQVVGLRGDAGIFVDCLNIWGLAFAIALKPEEPAACPPGTSMAGHPVPPSGPPGCNTPPATPVTTPPSGCTNCSPTTTPPPDNKIPAQAPGQPGGAGDGGKSLHGGDGTERHTADPNPSPPAAGNPPAVYNPPVVVTTQNPPGGTPAPSEPAKPSASGGAPSSNPQSTCVNPPGMNVCG